MRLGDRWLLLLGLLAGLMPLAASAHPHVWITVQSRVEFEQGTVTALFMRWGFDPVFSDFVLGEFDKNHDRRFDHSETQALIDGAFSNLREYGFLTHLAMAGKPVALAGFRDFSAHMEGDAAVYEFTLPLVQPLKLGAPLMLSVYDETFYIDVEFSAEDPVTFAGDGPACTARVAEDGATTIYYGMVHPLAATIACHAR